MDLSLPEAAKLLKVSEATLSRWVVDEGLAAYVINGRYRFNRVDLLEWASHRKLPTAVLFRDAAALPDLAALLEGNIHDKVPGSDLKSAMAAVAERLPLPSARDKALAAQVMAQREAQGSTAIGDGIAIPHARSPLVFSVDRPAMTLCFLEKPVLFGTAPVSTVFALVTPTVRTHLVVLSRISAALHDAAFRELLAARVPASRILARLKELA